MFPWASYPNTLGPAKEMYWYPLRLQILSEAAQNVQDSHSNNEIHISELTGTPEEYREAGGDRWAVLVPILGRRQGALWRADILLVTSWVLVKIFIRPAKKENAKFYSCQTEDYNLGTVPQKVLRTIPLIRRQGTATQAF